MQTELIDRLEKIQHTELTKSSLCFRINTRIARLPRMDAVKGTKKAATNIPNTLTESNNFSIFPKGMNARTDLQMYAADTSTMRFVLYHLSSAVINGTSKLDICICI